MTKIINATVEAITAEEDMIALDDQHVLCLTDSDALWINWLSRWMEAMQPEEQ